MLVALGIPLLYMELIVGQYLRKGPVHAMATVCPLLKGALLPLNIHFKNVSLWHITKCVKTRGQQKHCDISPLRSGRCISSSVLHLVHLLQPRHHLVLLLSLQFLPGTFTLGELQQHVEHTKLHQLCNQQQRLFYSQPGVLQVPFVVWGQKTYCRVSASQKKARKVLKGITNSIRLDRRPSFLHDCVFGNCVRGIKIWKILIHSITWCKYHIKRSLCSW